MSATATSGFSASRASSRSGPVSTAAATSKPWAVSSRTRPSRRRAWSSARTTRIGAPSLARHFQHHLGRAAGRAVDRSAGRRRPPAAAARRPAPRPRSRSAPPVPSSQISATTPQRLPDGPILAPEDVDPGARRAAVLQHVRQRLGDPEVQRRLARGRQPLGQVAADLDRDRRGVGQRPQRVRQPALGQDRRQDAADQRAQLGQRRAAVLAGLGEQRDRLFGIARGPGPRPCPGSGRRPRAGPAPRRAGRVRCGASRPRRRR